MEAPRVKGFELGRAIGFGECGRVYRAKTPTGEDCAVKVFDQMAISLGLLEQMTGRLGSGGWPGGVMPLLAVDLDSDPAFWVTPLLEGGGGDSMPTPPIGRPCAMICTRLPWNTAGSGTTWRRDRTFAQDFPTGITNYGSRSSRSPLSQP